MLDLLRSVVQGSSGYAEIRYHKRLQTIIEARNGSLARVEHRTLAGAGVRCLVDGCWGFVSTTDVTAEGLNRALSEAQEAARVGASMRHEKAVIAPAAMAQGEFPHYDVADEPSISQKINTVMAAEEIVRTGSSLIVGSIVRYTQYEDEKFIVTRDGAAAHILDNKPSFHVFATATRDGKLETAVSAFGVTGSWDGLLRKADLDQVANATRDLAVKKLDATYAPGGEYTCILDPMLVGVLSHEAIGHTVEADLVQSGSIVKGKLGQAVASPLITMVDDGTVEGASGRLLVDDEGVVGQRTTIIDKGILKDYLHSRESAAAFDAQPCGNSRAFTYRDEPLIRMTNTFVLPGNDNLDQMIAGIDDGFLLKTLGQGGQADSSAEFMFGVGEAYRIRHGRVEELVKGVTISGQAFDVLKSVDAVSSDFDMAMGAGHCGKWQLAKVDAGGPYIRCRVKIGGIHE